MFRNFFILWTISTGIFHVLLGCCSPYVSCCPDTCTMGEDISSCKCEGGCTASHSDKEEGSESEYRSYLSSSPCEHNHPSPSAPCDEVDCQFVFAPRTDDILDRLSIELLATVQDVLPASLILDVLPQTNLVERPVQLMAMTETPQALNQVWLI